MEFKKTQFKFFYNYCISKFGEDTGSRIYETAEKILTEMINEADYKNSKAIKWHMDKNMLPTMAMYFAFKKFEISCEGSYDYTSEILQIACKKIQKKNRFVGKIPFGYGLFKLFCKSNIAYDYPKEGWNIEWIKYNNHEVHFDFKSCIYLETTQRYNCVELCPLFCANDDITLAGYSPGIIFERSETLGRGQTKCDFHFKNSRNRE